MTTDLHSNIADLILDTIFIVDVHGNIRYISPSCENLLGYSQQALLGTPMIDLVLPEDRATTWNEAMRIMSGQPRVGFENRYVHKDGSIVDVMWSARWSPEHQVRIGVARNVTESRRQLRTQQAMFAISNAAHQITDLSKLYQEVQRISASMIPASAFAIAFADDSGRFTFQYQLDFGGDSSCLGDDEAREVCTQVVEERRTVYRVPAPADYSWLAAPLSRAGKIIGVIVVRSHPGILLGPQESDFMTYVAAQLSDAVDRIRLHAELLAAATTDELTGLPNRRLFLDRAETACRAARRHQHRFALLYLDIDDFKSINDTFGHAAGDAMLKEIGDRLVMCVREEDTVARLGGDEFVVLLPLLQSKDAPAAVGEKIRNAIAMPFKLPNGTSIIRQTGIGAAVFPDDGMDITSLKNAADKRLYDVKRRRLVGHDST
ncbi:PAS domain S-box-containing protein/diguanylate cyclase (GGDEF) domain-containing protein [Noviherbaspirillum humi]|uniref:PAS domain S-box-containing protein/diguanylate cyclase (GGDEF) domain-containing protein n=1 Tax=Noviherbaspirillum humi TaxID=1688639 RepID=A0A239J0P1_9BURK|nr:diguanylate cyclase [Noviherbaspirillum humi]SNS99379.1 PAS domain S-box-containing protein/diguanylate cyclase (GGDEF) domain-containing protein [Noviherbaspirillum humi]